MGLLLRVWGVIVFRLYDFQCFVSLFGAKAGSSGLLVYGLRGSGFNCVSGFRAQGCMVYTSSDKQKIGPGLKLLR